MSDVTRLSATELAAAIRARRISAVEAVTATLARLDAVNPALNAVCQVTRDSALREAAAADAALARGDAAGPLHGVPFTVKDTLETAGVPCTGGTTGRAEHRPAADATVVARFRAAGGILIGKTNTPEIAAAYETDNLVYGRTSNPWNLARTAGGSTGGESAIIAACGSPLGIGTDAGGSIRVPAHFCGLVGLKPTSGRIPRTGQFPLPIGARSALSHISLMARRVADVALALPVAAGPDFRDHTIVPMPLGDPAAVAVRGLKVAFFTDDGAVTPEPAIQDAVRTVARLLAERGATVVEARPPDADQAMTIFRDVFRGDGTAGARAMLAGLGTKTLSPLLERCWAGLGDGHATATSLLAAYLRWDQYRNAMLGFIADHDALVSPIAAFPALPHGQTVENARGFGYAMMHNLTGWPSIAVPVARTADGLPVGVQIAARPWREDVALALAGAVEATLGDWVAPPI